VYSQLEGLRVAFLTPNLKPYRIGAEGASSCQGELTDGDETPSATREDAPERQKKQDGQEQKKDSARHASRRY